MTSHVTRAAAMLVAAASLSAGLSAPAMADGTSAPSTPGGGQGQTTPSAKETLRNAIADAEKVDLTRNWADASAFETALGKAKELVENPDATEDQLKEAESDLDAAMAALRTTERDAGEVERKKAEVYLADGQKDFYPNTFDRLKTAIGRIDAGIAADSKEGDQAIDSAVAETEAALAAMDADNASVKALADAKAAARKELARGLTYDDKDATADLNAKMTTQTPDDSDQTLEANRKRDKAAKDIIAALGALQGKEGVQLAEYKDALKDAEARRDIQKDKGGKAYTDASYKPLEDLLAAGFDENTATGGELTDRANALKDAVGGLEVATWSIDGRTLARSGDGRTLSGTLDPRKAALEHPVLTGSDGSTVALTDTAGGFTQDTDKLGVGHITHTLAGTTSDHAKAAVSVTYDVAAGTETTVTLDDGSKTGATGTFTRNEDGSWTANLTGALGRDRDASAPASVTFKLSDGTTLDGRLGETVTTTPNGTTLLTRTLAVEDGKDGHGTAVRINAKLSYTYDPRVSLTLTHKSGTAEEPRTVGVDGLTADMDVNTLGAAYSAATQERGLAGDQWELNVKHGANVSNPTIAIGTSGEGSRILVATIPYDRLDADGHTLVRASKIVRVNVPFAAAPKVVGNEKAALAGIKVNGQDIPGFSIDKVDYTITAGKDERVRVSPVARDGQIVVAGDSRQTAYTTVQTWTVSKDGESRTYTVTLVRDHTEKTADERFTPADPSGQVSEAENPSDDNTTLESVGYVLKGEYHESDSDEFTIPEGGVLSWRSYAGQVVQPTVERDHGMTFRYELGVLSKDGTKYGTRVLTVTYLTADTHRAGLTGIKVDGRDVPGFSPRTMEYDVHVDNPERYVVTPSFDKMTGMSLTVHKTASKAVITVTSADGLSRAVYTLNISKVTLADTGAGVGLGALAALLAAGVAGSLLGRRRGAAEM